MGKDNPNIDPNFKLRDFSELKPYLETQIQIAYSKLEDDEDGQALDTQSYSDLQNRISNFKEILNILP